MKEENKDLKIKVNLVTESMPNALDLDLELKEETNKIALEWAIRYLNDLGIELGITQGNYEKLLKRPFTSKVENNENTNT